MDFTEQLGYEFLKAFPELSGYDPDVEAERLAKFITLISEYVRGPENFTDIKSWMVHMRTRFDTVIKDTKIRQRFIDEGFVEYVIK